MQDVVAEREFYDELFSRNPENEHITEGYEELHELAFSSPPEGRVLGLGCGTGAHAVRLAARGYDVLAVDLSLHGVSAARERFRAAGLEGNFIVADAENLPFGDDAIDTVWSSLLLHHFPKLDRLPDELARIARRRLIALEPNAHNFLSWFAFNVVNVVWGLSTTTRNQRALFPKRLHSRMSKSGFRPVLTRFIHRPWRDDSGSMSLIRSIYEAIARLFPLKYQANKFLVVYELSA